MQVQCFNKFDSTTPDVTFTADGYTRRSIDATHHEVILSGNIKREDVALVQKDLLLEIAAEDRQGHGPLRFQKVVIDDGVELDIAGGVVAADPEPVAVAQAFDTVEIDGKVPVKEWPAFVSLNALDSLADYTKTNKKTHAVTVEVENGKAVYKTTETADVYQLDTHELDTSAIV